MRKKRIKRRTLFICWAAVAVVVLALGIRALTQEKTEAKPKEPKLDYILIHTSSGESWGFCGKLTIETREYGGQEITLDNAWIVGSDHACYNPYAE